MARSPWLDLPSLLCLLLRRVVIHEAVESSQQSVEVVPVRATERTGLPPHVAEILKAAYIGSPNFHVQPGSGNEVDCDHGGGARHGGVWWR
ncbi:MULTISPECIES: hypothetical protein [Myxococcus]|uniref:hypothetical protein n=1 Tax=Myxococcus TaxID=32 RepID=UPI0015A1C218|nr:MULTISPECIES: hypothetical protein [Myxococcus]UYI23979.1 hypothetical protein N1129_09940 [Myxococcus xanthus]